MQPGDVMSVRSNFTGRPDAVLVDRNLSPGWVRFLQEEGHEAVHGSTVGAADAPDATRMRLSQLHTIMLCRTTIWISRRSWRPLAAASRVSSRFGPIC